MLAKEEKKIVFRAKAGISKTEARVAFWWWFWNRFCCCLCFWLWCWFGFKFLKCSGTGGPAGKANGRDFRSRWGRPTWASRWPDRSSIESRPTGFELLVRSYWRYAGFQRKVSPTEHLKLSSVSRRGPAPKSQTVDFRETMEKASRWYSIRG